MNIWEREQRMYLDARQTSPRYAMKRTEAPSGPVISFADACLHLRLGDPTSDEAVQQQPLVERMIAAAADEVERYCDIALLTQKWQLVSPWLPVPFYLPKAPLQSLDSVQDASGATVDPASYRWTADERMPGILIPISGHWPGPVWPVASSPGGVWTLGFTAGWGDDATKVPASLVQAMLLMVGTWFMQRESVQPFTLAALPEHAGVKQILDPFRVEVIA